MAVCASLFCRLALSIMNLVGPDAASSVALTFPPPPTHKPLPGSVLASSKDMGLAPYEASLHNLLLRARARSGLSPRLIAISTCFNFPFHVTNLFPSQNHCIIPKPRSRALTILSLNPLRRNAKLARAYRYQMYKFSSQRFE